jgi:hypothetical protein
MSACARGEDLHTWQDVSECLKQSLQNLAPVDRKENATKSERLKVGGGDPPFGGDHSSMMPLFKPIVTE